MSASLTAFADPRLQAPRIDPGSPVGATIEGYPGDIGALLGKLVGYFEDSETQSQDARWAAERDRDFKDGKQWTAEEVAILRKRRQPVTYNNIIGRKIELLCGLERRGRSDPKAFPRTPVEDARADAATQALRYVADENRFDVVRSMVYDNILVEGFGGAEVIVEPDDSGKGYDVVINAIGWNRLFYDPHSCHPGFADARYLGVVIWMDQEEAEDRYPGCDDILDATFSGANSDTYDDRPLENWADGKRRRVRVVQIHWKRKNQWWTATLTKGGFLEDPMISPYLDRHGNACCPIIMRSGKIDRDNNRFGVVRDMIPLQESINKRESKLLHALNVNRVIMDEGAVEDVDRARTEAAKPDGVIVKRQGFEFEIHKDQAEIQGQFELLQYNIAQMNATGPNSNMAGKDPRDQSGRAIIAQQAGGQVENEPMADTLRQWTHKIYEAAWMRIRQFWTGPKWIRVTDSDKNVKFVGLNNPVTIQDLLGNLDQSQSVQQQIAALPQDEQQAVQMGLQMQPGDPRLQTVVKIENNINDMDVDITVEEGPDNPTMQAEQFQMIMQLPPQILMQFPPEFIIQASDLRNKDVLIKMLEEHQQSQQQAQQAQAGLKMAHGQAEVAKVQAQAGDIKAQTLERLHGMATDHGIMEHQPALPGIGVVSPDVNPLLQPPPPVPAGAPGAAGPS